MATPRPIGRGPSPRAARTADRGLRDPCHLRGAAARAAPAARRASAAGGGAARDEQCRAGRRAGGRAHRCRAPASAGLHRCPCPRAARWARSRWWRRCRPPTRWRKTAACPWPRSRSTGWCGFRSSRSPPCAASCWARSARAGHQVQVVQDANRTLTVLACVAAGPGLVAAAALGACAAPRRRALCRGARRRGPAGLRAGGDVAGALAADLCRRLRRQAVASVESGYLRAALIFGTASTIVGGFLVARIARQIPILQCAGVRIAERRAQRAALGRPANLGQSRGIGLTLPAALLGAYFGQASLVEVMLR